MGSGTASADLPRRIRSYLVGCFRIDTRSLAVFRVLIGALIVADIVLRSRNFGFFYTNDGVVPQSLARAASPDNAVSLYYLSTDPTVVAALFALQILIALQLIVGYKTRVATILSFLLVISLDHHNPLVLSYADVLFRLLLFWAIFLPLGERWSIDAVHADRQSRSSVVSLASAAILLQIVYMYVVNGYHKAQSELWTGGEATVLIMGLDNTTFLLGDLVRNVPTLLQYGGLTWYYMLLFAWLLPLLRGRARMLYVAMFVGGHASFAITVRIGAFPYVPIAGLFLFLQARFWTDVNALLTHVGVRGSRSSSIAARLERLGARVPELQLRPGLWRRTREDLYTTALVVGAIFFLVLSSTTALHAAEAVDDEIGPEQEIDRLASTLGIDQPEWSVFAPTPRTTDWYFVFPAETEDGELLDVYNERELTYDRPGDELQKQFDTYRERFYMSSIARADSDDPEPELLAEHVCTTWPEEHGEELTHVNMYLVMEDVTIETIDAPAERERRISLVYAHGCGENEPKEIAPPEG